MLGFHYGAGARTKRPVVPGYGRDHLNGNPSSRRDDWIAASNGSRPRGESSSWVPKQHRSLGAECRGYQRGRAHSSSSSIPHRPERAGGATAGHPSLPNQLTHRYRYEQPLPHRGTRTGGIGRG